MNPHQPTVRVIIKLAVAAIVLWTGPAASGQGLRFGASDGPSFFAHAFAQVDPAKVPRLIKDLQDPDESVRLRAAKELGKLGASARDAIPALQHALKDSDEDVRRVAASSLKTIQASQPVDSPIQRLIRDLQNPDESVRLRAAKELGKIGPSAHEAIPYLEKLTRDPDEDVRRVATTALARVTEAIFPPPTTRPDLFMLSVGIDRYAPPVNSLQGCVNDAEGMAGVFLRQKGKGYGSVDAQVLTDAEGTRAKIDAGLTALQAKGKAGDWYVILLSGHGGPKLNRWGFITHDGKDVTDGTLLNVADKLASENKKVVIIIDACFAGQLRYAAHPILNKYADPRKGGIVLMLSSMPAQTSAALQRYSAFARAAEEGLAGAADYDGDQNITLKELRRFTYNRVYELCLDRRSLPGLMVASQDSAIDASLSIPETTPLTQGKKSETPRRDDGPFTSVSQLTGLWGAGPYRLQLNSNGIFRAAISQDNRIVQAGDGMFRANDKLVVLQHWQGDDRLEIVSLTNDEFRFRFQGREVALKKQTVAPPTVASLAGTMWTGTENLPGYGKLTFQFHEGGEASMIDAKKTVKGTWAQTANKVTITFQNCVYEATIQAKSMAGTAHFTTDGRTWTFSLNHAGAIPPPDTPPDAPVASVAGTVWSGTESLGGFGALTFEFHGDGKAVMIDAQSTVNGNWSQAGNQVTITFQNCVYVGRIQGSVLAGNARYTQGAPRDWTFSVTRRQQSQARPHVGDMKRAPVYVVPPGAAPDKGTWVVEKQMELSLGARGGEGFAPLRFPGCAFLQSKKAHRESILALDD